MNINKFDLLFDTVQAYLTQFRQQFDLVSKRLKTAPQGSIKIVRKGRRIELYHRTSKSDREGTYINKARLTLAKNLAQKDYDLRAAKIISKKIKLLTPLEKAYPNNELEQLYERYPQKVQQLIKPLTLSKQEYCRQWESVSYKGRPFDEKAPPYITDKGERVRSKSELIIANALFHSKVPYRYEYPILIKGAGEFHPDFLCLNPHTGNEILWEHFGIMDDVTYRNNAISKLAKYSEAGFVPGKNFIYTMETNTTPLNSRFVKKIILENFA
ncbi:MAG: hypothetical protein IK002_05990 [Treponema sp.]|uniref:hypothetical protein n=1 Tax=Treponema sp. TaxID=166 RepID=UPI00298DDF9D|nr:hypothetical protein [Treponema sp.]MBR5933523.1 hypothetical protein [Treponema sp.]